MTKYNMIARRVDNAIRNIAIGLAIYVIVVNFIL
jgi:hypothetical protein